MEADGGTAELLFHLGEQVGAKVIGGGVFPGGEARGASAARHQCVLIIDERAGGDIAFDREELHEFLDERVRFGGGFDDGGRGRFRGGVRGGGGDVSWGRRWWRRRHG